MPHLLSRTKQIKMNNLMDSEELGKLVREVWLKFCLETKLPPSHAHSAPWEELSQWEKEVDRRIGEAVAMRIIGLYETEVQKASGLLERLSKMDLHDGMCEKILVPGESCNCGVDEFQAEVSSAIAFTHWSSNFSIKE